MEAICGMVWIFSRLALLLSISGYVTTGKGFYCLNITQGVIYWNETTWSSFETSSIRITYESTIKFSLNLCKNTRHVINFTLILGILLSQTIFHYLVLSIFLFIGK